MAQKIWERFTPAEAKQLEMQDSELFSKYYDRYRERLYDRARTFMKHERTGSHGYKMIVEALKLESETGKNAYNLSKMSQILNSKWGSYSNQRRIDKQIAKSLNEHFGKDFVKVSDLDAFGEMMEMLRDSPEYTAYGSDQIAQDVSNVIQQSKKTGRSWKELAAEKFGKEYL